MRTLYPPGPRDLLGGLRLAGRLRADPLRFATELAHSYGDLASFRLGPFRAYVVNHPDLIHDVLVRRAMCFRKLPRVMRVLRQLNGGGVVIREGAPWLRHRRLLQPAFHPGRLASCVPVTVEAVQQLSVSRRGGEAINVAEVMNQLVLKVIMRTLCAEELSSAQSHAVCQAINVLSEVLIREMGRTVPWPDWLPGLVPRRKREALHCLGELIQNLVRARRSARPSEEEPLAALVSAGLSDRQVGDEMLSLLHAGLETTAAALSWLGYLLARHPLVQARIALEVEAVTNGLPVTAAHLPHLRYLDWTIKEVLRLYTPTWILFPREVIAEVVLGGYVLAPGSWLFMFPYALHRNPRWFPQPERFDPERFAPDRLKEIPSHAYIPFGAGPHLCLGGPFVLMLMRAVTTTLLQRFHLHLAADQEEPEPEPFLALRPKGGVCLHFSPRTDGSPE